MECSEDRQDYKASLTDLWRGKAIWSADALEIEKI